MARRPHRRPRSSSPSHDAAGIRQLPWQRFRYQSPPLDGVSADQLEAIHHASTRVLAETGLNFLEPEALQLLKAAGAEVDGQRVRFDPALIEALVAQAPATFPLHSRNPEHSVTIGGDHLVVTAVSSPPNATCLDRGRRSGNREDFENLLRLAQSLNAIHAISGHPVEPIDIPVNVRHLDATYAMLTLTDKPMRIYALGRQRLADALEMVRIGHGLSEEAFCAEPRTFSIINANSPLQFDKPMARGIIDLARRGQISIITPFTLAGAMAPVTIGGAVVQQNAEALAGIALAQAARPGAPVIYGGFTSNVDMKSGSPAFGTPENARANLIGGQLARRYRVPFRSSNVNASNAPDAQAVWESAMSLWSTLFAGVNFLHHGCGWLEGGLSASYEKMIIDAEMIQQMTTFLAPLDTSDLDEAVDAIAEVGPGGHFFASSHTMSRYQTAFYAPMLSDWRNYENWSEDGSKTATQRANATWKRLLADFDAPPIDPAIRDELADFRDRRSAEGGAEPDS